MSEYKIYHNPRCRKSRDGLQILQDMGVEIEIIEYLKTPPSFRELDEILKMLDKNPEDIIRKNEGEFKDNFKGKTLTREKWIKAMVDYPKLIERPIVVKGDTAVLGRPPELIRELVLSQA